MSSDAMTMPTGVPAEVRLHAASSALELVWDAGLRARLSSRTLRASCRCAACESDRRAGRPVPAADATPADLRLTGVEPLGSTGLQLRFADGHDRGIYPWAYLGQLAASSCRHPNEHRELSA